MTKQQPKPQYVKAYNMLLGCITECTKLLSDESLDYTTRVKQLSYYMGRGSAIYFLYYDRTYPNKLVRALADYKKLEQVVIEFMKNSTLVLVDTNTN